MAVTSLHTANTLLQVALLKEERLNLMNENEELFGKVKQAQTLSRKDSLKSRHLESELGHMKDEFERLKLEYDDTKAALALIDVRPETLFWLRFAHFHDLF